MNIQVNTDRNIDGNPSLVNQVEAAVRSTLDRFGNRVTRVEVHLSDENSHKGGKDDKRCLIEARLAGIQPVVVTHKAPTVEQAIDGATDKLERALESRLGKLAKR